jgi:hypothetical protein
MRLILFTLLLLTGCTSNFDHQLLLADYARHSIDKTLLSNYLEGDALESALNSVDLLKELDLSQRGVAHFDDVRSFGPELAQACLDVSAVSFLNSSGQVIELENRIPRQAVTLWFNAESKKISRLEVGGAC